MPFDVQSVRAQLPGRRIDWFESLESTMIEAAHLARNGCASGTLVGAEQQAAGMGRQGRAWHSQPGAGLYVSFILRPPMAAERIPLLMLALGLAAREAIVATTGLAPDLRWPNDVMLGAKKCAGILAHMETGSSAVIAGIGINVHHTNFPPELADIATSLALEGTHATREVLLVALAPAVDAFAALAATDSGAILDSFTRASSYVWGRHVCVDQDVADPRGAMVAGVTCGLDPSGFLRLRQDNGMEVTILAGGVRPV